MWACVLRILLLAGCDDGAPPRDTGQPGPDLDGDGWTVAEGDCDDGSPKVHPGADEVPGDGIDQTCDGVELCHADGDGDGFGTSTTVASSDRDCRDEGESVYGGDCDDDDPERNFAASEDCTGGRDEDCDGLVDCADPGCSVPSCPEACDDGRDNDDDHLTDCEDGDCAGEPRCVEDCTDRTDNDDDGLADCDDDDCWTAPPCRVLSIRVTGGRAEGRAVTSSVNWTFRSPTYGWFYNRGGALHRVRDLSLWSVTGTARVRTTGTWGIRTCTWSAPYATVHAKEHRHEGDSPRLARGSFVPRSFHGQSDCSFGSGFFPRWLEVVPGGGARHAAWGSGGWVYEGDWIDGSPATFRASRVELHPPSENGWVFSTEIVTHSWTLPSLATGVSYTVSHWR